MFEFIEGFRTVSVDIYPGAQAVLNAIISSFRTVSVDIYHY